VRTALRQFGERIDKVLVIDDDQDFVLLMRRLVEDNPLRPCQAIGAFSGQEGLLMLRLHRPDLVFLDLGLPDLAGTEVVEAIRNEPEWRETPIVIVSGQDEMANQQTMRGAVVIEKVGGLTPSEAVRWIQEVADSTLTAPPATPERPATPPR
jgi:CheY-like chemotaxis protein